MSASQDPESIRMFRKILEHLKNTPELFYLITLCSSDSLRSSSGIFLWRPSKRQIRANFLSRGLAEEMHRRADFQVYRRCRKDSGEVDHIQEVEKILGCAPGEQRIRGYR